ncbi:MAG TPA: helix-turn-helix domain-containing protein [Thermoanaerobaculia bacterium]|nr:helix-turn-helix domain-containing protein [Thermoanaerobaculia bacterium]
MSRVYEAVIVLLSGCLPSTSIAPMEILGTAGVLWDTFQGAQGAPLFRVRAVSIDGRPTHNMIPVSITPECSIGDVRHADLIIVPAAGSDLGEICATNALLIPWLQKWYRRGAAIAGICTGVSLVAEAGLLDGKPGTSHWAFIPKFQERYPSVDWQPERFVTESDNVFCSGGVYASIDLSLYLVEKFGGHKMAMETARALLLETPRMWQATYAGEPPAAAHNDLPVQKAQQYLFKNFREELTVDDLAERVGMSPRNFARRFKAAAGDTPLGYLHRLRINAAKHLLESGSVSVQEVCAAVGYEDVTFFRRLFKRFTGVPPREYRVRFGAA